MGLTPLREAPDGVPSQRPPRYDVTAAHEFYPRGEFIDKPHNYVLGETMRRKSMKKSTSKKLFRTTASRTHKKNTARPMRGGIRL